MCSSNYIIESISSKSQVENFPNVTKTGYKDIQGICVLGVKNG